MERQQIQVKCNKCGYVGDEEEFPKRSDFFQQEYISGCPQCDNHQSPGDASMRMFGGERPFTFVRPKLEFDDAAAQVLHNASEAS